MVACGLRKLEISPLVRIFPFYFNDVYFILMNYRPAPLGKVYNYLMTKSKLFGKVKRLLFLLAPQQWRLNLLQWNIKTRYKSPPLVFPWKGVAMKKVLAILPEEPVEAFHQINNYLRISALFKNATFTIFCTQKVGPYFQQVHPQATFIEYDREARGLFSGEFDAWGNEFNKEEFDVCLLLERCPDVSLLYLAGKTAAPVRAGYYGAGDYPFINMHVNPSPKRPYRAEQNALMAHVFGAPDGIKMNWSVSKETIEEIKHMARELNISPSSRIVVVDVGLFFTDFGPEWTQHLCTALKATKGYACCLYIEGEPIDALSEFVSSMQFPVFSNLTASRCAALIVRSACIISGKSVIFELSHLLQKPVIGVFEKDLLSRYCQQSVLTKGIAYSALPDKATIHSIVGLVSAMDGAEKT